MSDIEVKTKFLNSIGIQRNNYPRSFFEPIQNVNQLFTSTEIGYCASYESCDGKPGMFCIKDVVGTDHDRYAGKTWIEAFFDLDRGANIIGLSETNPDYWEEIKKKEHTDLGLIKCGDKFFIFSKAGGGNNRLITMKIRYLSLIEQANGNPDEIERINNRFTFCANIRELPEDYEIPFVVVSMCEDLGFSIKKTGDIFTVYKKFSNIVLYKGDCIGLKQYFRSLFDVDMNGEEEVKRRLEKIEFGCRISSPKNREVLESIIPQLKQGDILSSEIKR